MSYDMHVLSLNFNFQDDDGARSTTTIHFEAVEANFGEAKALADELAPLLAAISDAALLDYNVNLAVYDTAQPAPGSPSDVEIKGVFLLKTEDNFRASLAVPSIKESCLIADGARAGIDIDLTNVDVAALVDALVDGVTVGIITYEPSDRRGSDITQVVDAYKQIRSSFKARGRKG
jgi:hypothetical protein